MRIFVITMILIIIFACEFSSQEETTPVTVQIQNNLQGGFNIYSTEGDLLLEFTSQNTDSLSLETLKYIVEVGRESIDRDDNLHEDLKVIKTSSLIY